MKMLVLFIGALLTGLCAADPVPSEKVVVDAEFFDDQFIIYISEHDIINLVLPLNALNFDDDDDGTGNSSSGLSLFFTEVDFGKNGEIDYKGLYVLSNGTAHKLLDNGRDSTASNEETKKVYFAASDGIYVYNAEEDKAEKYGSLDDNFIHILQENGTDETTLYVINDKHEMFKVTGEGTKKEKLDNVINAQQFVMDFENNIYYYDNEKEVYIINGEGVTRVMGLKKDPKYIQLVKPAFLFGDYVPLVLDDQVYLVYANGTSELSDFEIKVKPTGYGLEGTPIQFYAYQKKIYVYNILEIIILDMLEETKEYHDDHVGTIKEAATRLRSSLRKDPKIKAYYPSYTVLQA